MANQGTTNIQKTSNNILDIPILGSVLDFPTLLLQYVVRLGNGGFIAANIDKCKRPEKKLVIYEYEGSPSCRKVREATSMLALDLIVKPCPPSSSQVHQSTEGSRYRSEALKLGGKALFPFLVDENTNKKLYGSADIVNYLMEEYGSNAQLPWGYKVATSPFVQWTVSLASSFRPYAKYRQPSRKPNQRLVLWGYEGSPFVARVRETLSVMEIEYEYKQCPKMDCSNRLEYKKRFGDRLSSIRTTTGFIQVPLLEDPNTGVTMLESNDIVEYLLKTYSTNDAKEKVSVD